MLIRNIMGSRTRGGLISQSNRGMRLTLYCLSFLLIFFVGTMMFLLPDSGPHWTMRVEIESHDHYKDFQDIPEDFYAVSPILNNEILKITSSCAEIAEGFIPIIDASETFQTFRFNDEWTKLNSFWKAANFDFEGRFVSQFRRVGELAPELTVFIVPHSHSDPGWLSTFEDYFLEFTKHTLDNAVNKLIQFPDMTFVWSEISFLERWWGVSSSESKRSFIQHVKDGRLEILTGGWVMTDEATVNLYPMIDQLIEGRQWIKANLGIVPTVSWSVDPFGHGSTFPYILKLAQTNQMVVQRLHYAWKKYFGEKRFEDFHWVQRWDVEKQHSILCRNLPYIIYTIKHSCGPNPEVCSKFDFNNVNFESRESLTQPQVKEITNRNVHQLSSELVEQFQKTASLQQHNVIIFPLGDDFRFGKKQEWDLQYTNYAKLIKHINSNPAIFSTKIQFGTVSDYFKAVNKVPDIHKKLPTFSGDLFPYSDLDNENKVAEYWTGYYGTRPYYKKYYREVQNHLRSAEILFTFAINLARQKGDTNNIVTLEEKYTHLVIARRNLALFAHHDGSTGTSRLLTMEDYAERLLSVFLNSLDIQSVALEAVFLNSMKITLNPLDTEFELGDFGDQLSRKVTNVTASGNRSGTIVKRLVVFNSLGWRRTHLVKVLLTSPLVSVYGPRGNLVVSQINPVVTYDETMRLVDFEEKYELVFLADLPPLGFSTFDIKRCLKSDPNVAYSSKLSVACGNRCRLSFVRTALKVDMHMHPEDLLITLSNGNINASFDGKSGLLQRIVKLKESMLILKAKLSYGGYSSKAGSSGAYLLNVYAHKSSRAQIPFKSDYNSSVKLIIQGPVLSSITLFQDPLKVTTTLLNTQDPKMNEAVFVENVVDLKETALEVYMRYDTDLKASTTSSSYKQQQPMFYTDQNGFTIERRVKVPRIGYQGNQYPVNNVAYIQDWKRSVRFSILVDRAHGFSSMKPGRLETLIERVTLYDDNKGMKEPVTDNRPTISNYVLMVEKLEGINMNTKDRKDYANNLLTLSTHRASLGLNFPPSIFVYDTKDLIHAKTVPIEYSFLTKDFPLDSHLINLRTISSMSTASEAVPEKGPTPTPSTKSLLIVQKLGFLSHKATVGNCSVSTNVLAKKYKLFHLGTEFNSLTVKRISISSDLAGVSDKETQTTIKSLPKIRSKPFEIVSVLITFGSV